MQHSAELRAATGEDLPAIAGIHLQAYSRSHFTSLLPRTLLIYYYGLFQSDGAQTVVLTRRGDPRELVGFAVFGRGLGEKIAQFKKDKRIDIVKASLAHPVTAGRKAAARVWTRFNSGQPPQSASYLLLSIAVARPGTGAGGQLLDAFLAAAAASGEAAAGLFVNADNVSAINAYIKRGFVFRDYRGGQFYMERTFDGPFHRAQGQA